MVVLVVLAMVGYGLYVGLNNGFQFQNKPVETPDWLQQEMGSGAHLPQGTPSPATGIPSAGIPSTGIPSAGAPGAGPVSLGQPVALGQETGQAVSAVPQARYPANVNTDPLNPPRKTGPSSGPVAIVPDSDPVSAPVPENGASPPLEQKTVAGAPQKDPTFSPGTPPAVGSRPDPPHANNLNLSNELAFNTAMKSAKLQLQQGQLTTALLSLSIWYGDPRLNESQQTALTRLLDQVAGSVIYSRKHLIEPAYTARQGETLEEIAKSYRVPVGLLAKINGISNLETPIAGQDIKVVRGPFNATINGEQSELVLWLGGRYAGRFSLAMGPEFQGIVGPFVVEEKTRMHPGHGNQPWIRLVPGYGIKDNPTLSEPQVGIAGMQQPAIAKRGDAPGQIGVSVRDADDLFDILSQGSKVTIQR